MTVVGFEWPFVLDVIMRQELETHEGIGAGNTPVNIGVRGNPGAQDAQERRCAARLRGAFRDDMRAGIDSLNRR
jgi:hypothetical protein